MTDSENILGIALWFEDKPNDTYSIGLKVEGNDKLQYFNGKGKFPHPFEKSDATRPKLKIGLKDKEIFSMEKTGDFDRRPPQAGGKPFYKREPMQQEKILELYKTAFRTVIETHDEYNKTENAIMFSSGDLTKQINTLHMGLCRGN